ncbi:MULTISPECIES: hypothetical protein [unclassified Thermosipho (in: thermotogales)]|nr:MULTISPECIES: hypothetical protein [unclassified Thermosipho (in: thermotogales)]
MVHQQFVRHDTKKYLKYNLAVFLKSLTYFDDAEKNKDFQKVENS